MELGQGIREGGEYGFEGWLWWRLSIFSLVSSSFMHKIGLIYNVLSACSLGKEQTWAEIGICQWMTTVLQWPYDNTPT